MKMKPHHLVLFLVALAALLLPVPARAQGCTQCRDNTAATSPATQRAYRHAIVLMAGAASVFFLGTVALLRKKR
jgi:hypothetical protein